MKPRSGNGGMRWSDISQELLTKLKERDAYRREVRERFLEAWPNWDELEAPARVSLAQEVKAAGLLSDHISFFLIVWALEKAADDQTGETYERDFAERFRSMEERLGIDPDGDINDAPAEYRELDDEYVT